MQKMHILCTKSRGRTAVWCAEKTKKKKKFISNLHMHSNTNDEFLHPWAAFHAKTSCSGWISAGDCDLLIWISLSQVSALHVDIHDWTCRWHQKPSGRNYWLIIATSQIIIRGWQNSGPAWRAIDSPCSLFGRIKKIRHEIYCLHKSFSKSGCLKGLLTVLSLPYIVFSKAFLIISNKRAALSFVSFMHR